MHATLRKFVASVREQFPEHFDNRDFQVLNVGALDVNGSDRQFFSTPENVYGIDLFPGPSVDQVCAAHEFDGEPFRTVICTSMLEHDQHWQLSVPNMVRLTAPGGLLLITCAGPGYAEHCTKAHPMTLADGRVLALDHYRNLGIEDLGPLLLDHFSASDLHYAPANHDTFFWGLKR